MAEEEINGAGRKRPQINIPLDRIDLDDENPRLAEGLEGATQNDLIKTLYENFSLSEIAFSMAANGYFDEEPIVVIPKKLSSKHKVLFEEVENGQKEFEFLIKTTDIRFIVVEGNRRIATAKILANPDLRKLLNIKASFFPEPKNNFVLKDIQIIPSIVYPDRSKISSYLGVRHIIGLLKWEAYAKALFLSKRVDSIAKTKSSKSINDAIEEIQRETGDRTDVIKKQYLYFKLFKEAEDDLSIDTDHIKDRFSLLTVAMNSPSIREYISAPSYKEADFSKRLIPIKKLDKFTNLLTWVFGDGKGKESIITDSRKITSHLQRILAHKEAREYLEKTDNLNDAYDLSDGEKEFFYKKLSDAQKALKNALGLGWKYKSSDVIIIVEELEGQISELKRMVNQ